MPWIKKASLAIATDLTMAAAVNQPGSFSEAAVDGRVRGVAAEIIAESPTVVTAASNAVTAAIAGKNIVETRKALGLLDLNNVTTAGQYLQGTAGDATLARHYPVEGAVGTLEVIPLSTGSTSVMQRFTRFLTSSNYGAVEVYERTVIAGTAYAWARRDIADRQIGTVDVDTMKQVGSFLQSTAGNATLARHYPAEGAVGVLEVFQVNPSGTVVIQRYTQWSATGVLTLWHRIVGVGSGAWVKVGGSGGGFTPQGVSRVVVLAGAGQSNIDGRGLPIGTDLDPVDPRILMWDWNTAALETATVPLASRAAATGLSPLTVIARRILEQDANARVVIVNGGVGGSALVGTSPNGRWDITDGASLYTAFKAGVSAAVAAAATAFTLTPTVLGYWHQGEQDATGSVTKAQYEAAFAALWADFRSAFPNTPVVLGGISPEWPASNKAVIQSALVALPGIVQRTAFAPAPRDGSGSSGAADTVHFHRGGVERLGAAMHAATPRAMANVDTMQPQSPVGLAVEVTGGTATITWQPPLTRVTSYTLERRVDGGTWTAIPHTTLDPTSTVTGLTGAVLEVRASATNEVGTSAWSTTAKAPIHV